MGPPFDLDRGRVAEEDPLGRKLLAALGLALAAWGALGAALYTYIG